MTLYIDALFNYLMSEKIVIYKDLLVDLYKNKELSTYDISKKFNCCQATIWKKLREFNIQSRSSGLRRLNLSKEQLNDLYINKKFSTWRIEKELGIPRSSIHRKLKEFGISVRDRADSHIVYLRKDFSGDLLEKAYLIGFRMGDLGVRKMHSHSKTIYVASGSTIPEQIYLIKNLFKKYGQVWTKKTKENKINLQVSLNLSFNFLLSKEFPSWVLNRRSTFFSFLAGFTDAEGSIRISNKMAYYSLGNYDKKTLFLIYKNLNKFGISCNKPRVDNRKGTQNNQGYKYSSNYWTFKVHNKSNLLKLFFEFEKYLKHPNKVKDLNRAFENIQLRNKTKNET